MLQRFRDRYTERQTHRNRETKIETGEPKAQRETETVTKRQRHRNPETHSQRNRGTEK